MPRLLPLVLLAAFLLVPAAAEACSCGVHSLCTRYARAAAVFAAEVVDAPTELADRKVARVKVLRSYKGDAPSGGIVTLLTLPGSAASCSIDLEPGQRYVFFAGGSAGTYGTSLCSGNIQVERGAPLPDLPPQPGQVRGELFHWDDATLRTRTPIAGARVWIDTPRGAIASRTDAHGRFQLSGVPPGRRFVRFDAGPDGEADAVVDLASTADCADVFATPKPRGGLAGTVIGVDGKPIAGARVYVRRAGGTYWYSGPPVATGPTGAFSVPGLAPGRYLVGVGLRDAPSVAFPFLPLHHPGVPDPESATPVEVRAGTVRLPAFRLGAPLPLTSIGAEILCRDGSRPAIAFLTAERASVPGGAGTKEFGSVNAAGGRWTVRVVRGYRYSVRGEVGVKERVPGGHFARTSRPTPAVVVDPDAPPARLVLRSELEKCGEPGGVDVPARW